MDAAHRTQVAESNPIVRMKGMVKWFDLKRGYGFVVPESGEKDVLLHLSTILRDKAEVPREGAVVSFMYQRREKGLQCMQVLAVDNSTAVIGDRTPPVPAPQWQSEELPWHNATVKWFNPVIGYGFAAPADEKDIFIHKKTLRACGMTELQTDQVIQVRWFESSKGRQASAVRTVS